MSVNRVFVTGDLHGHWENFDEWCVEHHTTYDDVFITLGDSGILYGAEATPEEHAFLEWLNNCPITILDIQGNHACPPEDRPGYLKTLMQVGDDMVGIAYQNYEFPHIYHAINGNTYYLKEHPCLVVGGAYSVDKELRLARGWYWTPNEIINPQDRNNILHQIHTRHFDCVFTHTIPFDYVPRDMFLPSIDQSKVDNTMEHFLTSVKKEIKYDKWLCGHWHVDRHNAGPNIDILYKEVRQLW